MRNRNDKSLIDGQLLGNAIIELNTSHRIVGIYPHDHPNVERSLERVIILLNRLFGFRPQIKIGIAKDTLIIDNYYLEKKNPVYREFAQKLSSLGICFVTFFRGLTKDEVYRFHNFLVDASGVDSEKEIIICLKNQRLRHIKLDFVDYDIFTFDEGETQEEKNKEHLWESYIYALLRGKSLGNDELDEISRIEPEHLAELFNTGNIQDLKEESYNRFIATYLRTSSTGSYSGKRLTKLVDFIMRLSPDIKKQFLCQAMKWFSSDTVSLQRALEHVSVDTVINLLQIVSEQRVILPETLMNLFDALSRSEENHGMADPHFGDSCLVDDILLSPQVTNLLSEGDFRAFVTNKYEEELHKVLQFNTRKRDLQRTEDLFEACQSRDFEEHFSHILVQLVTAGVLSDQEIVDQVPMLQEQGREFVKAGQYAEALHVIKGLEDFVKETFPDIQTTVFEHFHSREFVSDIIQSLRALGRLNRKEAAALCDYYGEGMIPYLIDALVEEESAATRRFFVLLITRFGQKAAPEAIRRLEDGRWYVKRNMLTILTACGGREMVKHVKACCQDENPKVVSEAAKCLLEYGDEFGVEIVMQLLNSHSTEHVNHAISLIGTYQINEAVPVLIGLLEKQEITRTDYLDKIPIVKALGEIGDPKSIEALRNLASSKSILFKSTVERLKEEIFKTLKYYPIDHVLDIAQGGTRSKNSVIRNESLQLVKRASQENMEQRQSHGVI